MANVLHRITKQYIRSVNEPEYPLIDWIHNPDLSAVIGFASHHWVITGDAVTLMGQASRDAVDAEMLESSKDAEASRMDSDKVLSGLIDVIVDRSNATGQGQGLPDITAVSVKAAVRGRL